MQLASRWQRSQGPSENSGVLSIKSFENALYIGPPKWMTYTKFCHLKWSLTSKFLIIHFFIFFLKNDLFEHMFALIRNVRKCKNLCFFHRPSPTDLTQLPALPQAEDRGDPGPDGLVAMMRRGIRGVRALPRRDRWHMLQERWPNWFHLFDHLGSIFFEYKKIQNSGTLSV